MLARRMLMSGPLATVPVGLILPFTGGVIPDDWSAFSSADDKFIVGAGSNYTVGTNGGAATKTIFGLVNAAGLHDGTSGNLDTASSSAGAARREGGGNAGEHVHTLSADCSTENVYKNYKLIKADKNLAEAPEDAICLSVASLAADLTNTEGSVDRFLRAAATAGGTGGNATSTGAYTTSANSNLEGHPPLPNRIDSGFPGSNYLYYSAAGPHQHTGTLSGTLNTKRIYCAAWHLAASAFPLVQNAIGMYESLTPPPGWGLCDGSGGRPDLRDFFVRIGSTGVMGNTSGDNSLTYADTTTSQGAHNHQANANHGQGRTTTHTNNTGAHQHSVSIAGTDVVPPWYALAFIIKL